MSITVSTFLNEWLQGQAMLLQRSTYEAYQIYFRKHLIPYFDSLGIELEELTPMHVNNYTKLKMKSGRLDGKSGGLSLVSVKKHLSVLKQALNEAVLLGYIKSNPAMVVKLPKRKGKIAERTVMMNIEEAQKVINAFEGHILYTAVILALYYGLRRSEVLGLKWSAVDFENNTITINHTVVKNLTIEAKDSTKTEASNRTFQLLPEIKELLLKIKVKSNSKYINSWEDGRLIRPDYMTKSFQKVLASHNLPKMRFHDLRHSTASILFDMGWQLEDVKNWLGHSDIETTSNIYLHYGRKRSIMLAGTLAGKFVIK